MHNKRTFGLTILLSTLLLFVTACAPQNTAGITATTPTGDGLYVLDGSASPLTNSTALHIVGFYPQGTSATVTLPAGLLTQDHQRLFTATPQNGKTLITITNTQTGTVSAAFSIPGTYSTEGAYYINAILSPDAHWFGLRQVDAAGTTTSIALIDTQAGKLTQTIKLHGRFDLDALSNDGMRIYLLERLNGAGGNYHVRLYYVDQNKLYENAVVDKTDLDPNMVGTALTRQMAPDGSAAYTLYTQPAHNTAFVHLLPLNDIPFARCIDLPVGKSPALLKYYTLTLSHDGHTLYAVNAALGLISIIGLDTGDILNAQLTSSGSFNIGSTDTTGTNKAYELFNGAALSPDGKTLYVVGIHGILALDTTNLRVHTYLAQQALTGVAVSGNGQTLYAVSPGSGITLINISTGQTQTLAQSPAHSPWGIEWIATT